jgi:hypothetical protein
MLTSGFRVSSDPVLGAREVVFISLPEGRCTISLENLTVAMCKGCGLGALYILRHVKVAD